MRQMQSRKTSHERSSIQFTGYVTKILEPPPMGNRQKFKLNAKMRKA